MIKQQPFESIRRIVWCYPVESHHHAEKSSERSLNAKTDDSIALQNTKDRSRRCLAKERMMNYCRGAGHFHRTRQKYPSIGSVCSRRSDWRWIQIIGRGLESCSSPGVIAEEPDVRQPVRRGLFALSRRSNHGVDVSVGCGWIGLFERATAKSPSSSSTDPTIYVANDRHRRNWAQRAGDRQRCCGRGTCEFSATRFLSGKSDRRRSTELWGAERINDLFAVSSNIVILTLP